MCSNINQDVYLALLLGITLFWTDSSSLKMQLKQLSKYKDLFSDVRFFDRLY